MGFAGLLMVAVPGGGGQGAALSILAAVAITSGTLLARRLGHLDVVMVSAWHFVIGGTLLAVAAGAVEGVPRHRLNASVRGLPRLPVDRGNGGGLRGLALGRLAAWTFLVPIFGVVLGVVVLGERPGWWTVAGLVLVLVLVLGSLLLALRPTPRHTQAAAGSALH